MTTLIAPPGLKGLIVADTTIGSVDGDEGFFHYREHDATQLAGARSLEAVARLLVDGRLPEPSAEASQRARMAAARRVDPDIVGLASRFADAGVQPLATLRALIPLVTGTTAWLDQTADERRDAAVAAIGATPTLLAAVHRMRCGLTPLGPDPALGHAADYVRMVTGSTPAEAVARAVDTYLTLTADHGFNASTFTARVIASTGTDIGGALAGAIAALGGPLHGGAPSRVLDMIDEIGDPANTERWVRARLISGAKIMGFGHAVYRTDDPRTGRLRETALRLGGDVVDRAVDIEERILSVLADWRPGARIVTNVEFYAAVVLHLAGIPQDMFTATFATSRVVGWCAHILEQTADNKIMRPTANYVGPRPVRLVHH